MFEWFQDEFERFDSKVKRLQRSLKFFRVVSKTQAERKELILEDYLELDRHLKQTRELLIQAIAAFKSEHEKAKELAASPITKQIIETSYDVGAILAGLENMIDNGLHLTDEILRVRLPQRVEPQKNKLMGILEYVIATIDHVKNNTERIVGLEKKWKQELKQSEFTAPVSKIKIIGTLNNGWRLSRIQNVIIELGGKVIETPGAAHQYKIIFPGAARPIPLFTSTPPDLLVREIFAATKGRVSKKQIIESFSQGELVSV